MLLKTEGGASHPRRGWGGGAHRGREGVCGDGEGVKICFRGRNSHQEYLPWAKEWFVCVGVFAECVDLWHLQDVIGSIERARETVEAEDLGRIGRWSCIT